MKGGGEEGGEGKRDGKGWEPEHKIYSRYNTINHAKYSFSKPKKSQNTFKSPVAFFIRHHPGKL